MAVPSWLCFGFIVCFLLHMQCSAQKYEVSDELGLGRKFDGIGGLSGGGPNFGASLHILKVEIGGDDQTTDGTEASHMHEEWDENYNRGYEWWLMKEAKKRNPDIKLYGLSWAWPGWIGGGKQDPYNNVSRTALYITKWIQGAKQNHGLDIDYIGIWNERACNWDYLLQLRKTLDSHNLQDVIIIACDDSPQDVYAYATNKTMASAAYAFGVHYPGTRLPDEAIATNYTVWSSEDYSTNNNDVGAGCWARILNQNYVNGYMTSTISWNLIASYYRGLPYDGDGLMSAVEPWSGYYEVKNPIWVSAHTTQFADIGFKYLLHGHGVGLLQNGGSYVSLTSKDRKNLTIVIETFSHDHSVCIRPKLPAYTVKKQTAVFKFGGSFAQLTELYLWKSQFNFDDPSKNVIFHYEGAVQVSGGQLSVDLDVDTVITLTTSNGGWKGDFGPIPDSQPFPLPYHDDFERYDINEEPYLLAPQSGVWETLRDKDGNQFSRQTILTQPISWCDAKHPAAIIGDANWQDLSIGSQLRIPSINGTSKLFLGLRITKTGCDIDAANGVYFWVTVKSRNYTVTSDIAGKKIIANGSLSEQVVEYDTWYNLNIGIKDKQFTAKFNNTTVAQLQMDNDIAKRGFAAVGTGGWGYADYDNLVLSKY